MSRSRLKMFLIYLMQEADDSCGGKSQIVYLPGGTVVTSTNKRLIKQTDEGTEHHVQFSRVYVVCKYFITLQITLLFATRWVIENNLWPSETTIDSKLLLDVYVRVIIMINFINRISGHANSSQRIQQKMKLRIFVSNTVQKLARRYQFQYQLVSTRHDGVFYFHFNTQNDVWWR